MADKPDHYVIKNWGEFQHYKDRAPAWIKMHFSLLASEDWVMLSDASRLLAVVCMLVASRHNGTVPNKPAYIKRVAYLDHEPDLEPLISCGFLTIPLADASATQAVDTERLSREENKRLREEKKEEHASVPTVIPIDSRAALFHDGLPLLASLTNRPAEKLKPVLGRWMKLAGDDAAAVHAVIVAARDKRVVDPIPWIEKALHPKDRDQELYRGVI